MVGPQGQPLAAGSWPRLQLQELLDRSLIMQVPAFGKYLYHMHDVLRDLAISESKKSKRQAFIQPVQMLEKEYGDRLREAKVRTPPVLAPLRLPLSVQCESNARC
jgi:hypothetical protein